jgi:glycosyltransferase involved in cell wall biosynthesis
VSEVSVVILTLNEERNLPFAIDSVKGWAEEILVLDSGSTDRTLEIAIEKGCRVFERAFVSYSDQRNHALRQLPVKTEWVFFLDADERLVDELKGEIDARLASRPVEDGFVMRRKLLWMGRWIRRGYFSTWILRLVRRERASCDSRPVNEHLVVEGSVGRLRNAFIHQDRNGVASWARKHVRYAELEADLLRREFDGSGAGELRAGKQAARTRWIRSNVWVRIPPVVRPWFYFIYRYVFRGGFLDGTPGFIFHFMQALWFQTLIDAIYLEESVDTKERAGKSEDTPA